MITRFLYKLFYPFIIQPGIEHARYFKVGVSFVSGEKLQ